MKLGLGRFFKRYDIGRNGDPYLTRWDILGTRFTGRANLFLHQFHRGDYEGALHDHPWSFWSLILWGGYFEVTEHGERWYPPLSLLRRPAEWRHRVKLAPDRKAWSLVWTGRKVRKWGFWCASGFTLWDVFAKREEQGEAGCQ